MRYNRLGQTGLDRSELCLGAMTFGNRPSGLLRSIAGLDQDGLDRAGKAGARRAGSTSSTPPTSTPPGRARSSSAGRSRALGHRARSRW